MNIHKIRSLALAGSLVSLQLPGVAQKFRFTVSTPQPASHYIHVDLQVTEAKGISTEFRMPVWTPGYYQRLDFANNVEGFTVKNTKGDTLAWEKVSHNGWQINHGKQAAFTVSYKVKTNRLFVANPYVDEERAFIRPTGVFVYPAGKLELPATVVIKPANGWRNVATGLDSVKGKPFTYTAPNFDVLFDSPLLVGNLEELPAFTIKGIPHRFIGYKMGDFNKQSFMDDLKKLITVGTEIIGDIPYKHYTFMSISPNGMGGIEQLNSTSVSFSGQSLDKPESRRRVLNFLAHEYFHHYNVKRIRPVELGPFDYDNGNHTNLLWVSEGLTVYYEYFLVKRAGLSTETDLLNYFKGNISAYEKGVGKTFQSLQQASFNTWSDGPFGRRDDKVNKTISYYDKGPAIGLLFDFAIRQQTQNKKSLDDVMRTLYNKYYRGLKRGFTEAELQEVIIQTAGAPLDELFDYIYTTKAVDYNKYLAYAGLTIDLAGEKPTYTITRLPNPDALQQTILKSWLGE